MKQTMLHEIGLFDNLTEPVTPMTVDRMLTCDDTTVGNQ